MDKLERDLFVGKIKSTPPLTKSEESLLSRSLEHADLRLVDGLRLEELNHSKRQRVDNTLIPQKIKLKRTSRISAARLSAKNAFSGFFLNRAAEKWKRIQGGDDLVIKKYIKFVKDDAVKWGKATATVHTSPEEALAWLWDYCSYERMRGHQKRNGNKLRKYYDPTMQQRVGDDENVDENREKGIESRTRHVVVRKAIARTVETRESNVKLVW